MESIDAHSNELDVENITLHDVKLVYYCFELVEHWELIPFMY
jgi:hypothetical protein